MSDNKQLLEEKIFVLEKALITEYDPSVKFKLQQDLEELKNTEKLTSSEVSNSASIVISVGCPTNISVSIQEQLTQAQQYRLKQIKKGENPYASSYEALPFESSVFVGRESELRDLFATYNHPTKKPASMNIVGERRIGKTSILNQLIYYLKQIDRLVLIHFSAQAWQPSNSRGFFSVLLNKLSTHFEENYEDFEMLLSEKTRQGFRFLIIIDEFEELCNYAFVNATFLSKLRSLADNPNYSMGYLLVSRSTVHELQKQHKTESSSFHGIFGTQTVKLLNPKDVKVLTEQIWLSSLGKKQLNQANIYKYAGQHPLLLQIVLRQIWQDIHNKEETNWKTIHRKCNERYEDWWNRCNDQEKQILLDSAKGDLLNESDSCDNLHLRGLLIDDKPFSEQFQVFIQQTGEKTMLEPLKDNEPAKNAFTFLKETITQVPALKYASGIAGIAAAVSIVKLFTKDLRIAFISIMFMLMFMVILFIFDKIGDDILSPLVKKVFVWFILGMFMLSSVLLFTSVFFNMPLELGKVMMK